MFGTCLLLSLWGANLIFGDVGVTDPDICMRSGILTKLRPIPIWEGNPEVINRAKIVNSLNSLQGLVTKSVQNVESHLRGFKTGSTTTSRPDFVHDATHKWLGPELEDSLVEVENVAPGQIDAKCRAAKAKQILFYDKYSTQVYYQKLAKMRGVSHLIPDGYYDSVGLRERYTGDLMQVYGRGESAAAAKDYKPAVFDVTTGKFIFNYDQTIAKTLCIKHQRFHEMTKTHFAVHKSGYEALTDALGRIGSFVRRLLQMLSSLPVVDKTQNDGNSKEVLVSPWQTSQLFDSLLLFSDRYYHQKYDNQAMERIRSFIAMTDQFLGNNLIINKRQVVLKLAHSKIARLAGLDKGVVGYQPYVRVTLETRRKGSEDVNVVIEAITDNKAALFLIKPIIRNGVVHEYPYVTITPRSKFVSLRPPPMRCVRLPFQEVCDIQEPSSHVSFDCAEYLLGNRATGHIQDHCLMTPSPTPVAVVAGSKCIPEHEGGLVISAVDETQVKLVCPHTGTKQILTISPRMPTIRSANETGCNIVVDGTPVRRVDSQLEAHKELVVNELRAGAEGLVKHLSSEDLGVDDPLVQGLAISLGAVGGILVVTLIIMIFVKYPDLSFHLNYYICAMCSCCNPQEARRLRRIKEIMDIDREATTIARIQRRNEEKFIELQAMTNDLADQRERLMRQSNPGSVVNTPLLPRKDIQSRTNVNPTAP